MDIKEQGYKIPKIVNIGDRIWFRERGIDDRTEYATVIHVDRYCVVTLQGDGWQRVVNLGAVKSLVDRNGNYCTVDKYVWSKINC